MTSVEKRRSSRKSGGHRKHSDGGFSDASSGGSFLDETDREVSNLTDRAFRSLCIGDEAVYNDSDLSLSSPSTNSDRQLAFCEERERDDRKRAAQDNFNVRVQQYGQDWITGGMYGADIHRGPQWEACGERTQGMVSATFQHSLVETSQLGKSLMEEELSFLSNGATELSSQQRRSHSRVSSLIRAFDSDGHRDGVEMDHKIKERDDATSWDKSALMSIQRELSEFSYQQNFNSHHFHPAGPLSSRDAETKAQISRSYMRSSQTKHSMSSQVNCSSNFFIHSEFSPFRLWRDYNRFPFQPAEAAGFMHYSEFPKWYQTPMYNELYLENQAHSHHRDFRHQKNHLGLPVPLTAPRSSSTSSQLQRASAVEKRCESELTVHHPHRKWTQKLGTNKLPSHRPSTASPSTEMSRCVRDTISSVKALQQKVKMMSEHDMTNQQGVFSRNDGWVHLSNSALTVETNVVSSNTANPFRIGQLLTPSVHQHQNAETSHLHLHEVSPQPVEHPPVRAESRGATPDIRMSNYRSRATSLLFNLKDNRKRVKSTYSPTKFKGLDTAEKNQQSSVHELHETVFTDSDMQCLQPEAHRRTNSAVNQYHTPGLTTQTSHPANVNTGQYPENTASNYQAAQMQCQMGYGSGFSGFVPSKYFNNQPKEEKQIQAEKERVQKLADEPTNVTEKVPKKLKTEQAETERLKEEHIKTELAMTEAPEWVRINQFNHEEASGVQAEEKQQGTEKAEGEQMEAEKIKMEKVKAEQIRGEQKEPIKEPQPKTRDIKRMEVEVLEVKTDHMKVEDVREAREEKESSQTHQIKLERATTSTCCTEIARAEKANLEENLEQKESELSKTEKLLERSAKLSAKLASKQQVRQEPDRVEQVKTELAKAKAELAKIKEKMKGEQKEKRPHSQEAPKKHESTVSNKIPPTHHVDSSGVQKEPAKFALSLSSDTVGGGGATTADRLQKPTRTIQPTGTIVSSAESCAQKEPEILQQKEANHIETSRKQTCELQQVGNDETLDKTKQDLAQCASISKPVTKEDTKKKEAAHVDLGQADCVNQKEPCVTDDSVQIMGIMVTVVERQVTVNTGPQNNNAEKQTIASEKEGNKSVEEIPSQEEVEVLVKAKDSKKSQPIMKEDEATLEPQDLFVKTQSLPNKTEISATAANKEPKLLVFPIMEKEHQRTGMFKLGDKERQEKMNTKMNICLSDNESHVDQTVKNKSSTAKTEVEAPLAQEHQRRAAEEEQQRKEQQRREVEEQQKRAAQMEIQSRLAEEKHVRKNLHKEQQRRAAEKQQKRAAKVEPQSRLTEEEQRRKAAHEEQQRRAAEEQQRRLADEEQQRKAAHEEQQRREVEEQQRWLAEEGQRRKAAHEKQQRRAAEEQQRRLAEEEQKGKAPHEEQRRVAEEQQKRAVQVEQHRRLAEEEQKRIVAHEELQRRDEEEQQKRAAQMKIQKRLAEEEQIRQDAYVQQQRRETEVQQRTAAQLEQQRRLAEEDQRRKAAHEEQQKREAEEKQRMAARLEQQRRIEEEEQRKKAARDEQQRVIEEQQKRAVQMKHHRRLAEEEQKRRKVEEQQRRAAQMEIQKRLTEEEQRRHDAHEEQQRRAAEEKQRRAAQLEIQKRLAEEEQRRQDAHKEQQRTEEQQKRDAQVEQHRRLAEEEQKRRKVEEQQKRAAHMEIQKRLEEEEFRRQYAHEEQQRKGAEEQQRRLTEGPHMRKGAHEQERKTEQKQHGEAEQQQRRSLQDEQQRKATEEKQRRPSQLEQTEEAHEQQRKTPQEEKQREVKEQQQRVAQKNKQRIVSPKEQTRRDIDEQERTAAHNDQQREAAHGEQQKRAAQEKQHKGDLEEHRKRVAQEKQQRTTSLIEEQRQVKQVKEIVAHNQKETNGKPGERINVALVSEKGSIKHIQEHIKMQHQTEEPIKEEKTTSQKTLENENKSAEKEKITREQKIEKHLKHECVKAQEFTLTKTDNDIQPKKIKGDEQLTSLKEKARDVHMEMEKRAAEKTDALQFYAITSTNREKRPGERQLPSPSPLQQQNKKQMELESPNNLYHTRPYRPAAAASPAPSLPRSNTSSPALGTKPLMFRVKDNTNRGSSFTKSVKPRFHKNFGEDFLMGLTLEGRSDKTQEDQEKVRRNAGTPLNRFSAISESATFLSPSSSQDYSNSIPHLRPYSRRSMAVDDDDESHSVISNMSEDVESFATSAADLTDMHGLFDFDRPESACSFSSDVSRSLGKPPTVPAKSEKALRRAQRLTSRRIKKELSKAAAERPTGVVKEVSSFPSSPSSSNEVCSSNHHAVASPHFSPPVAFALAPTVGSCMHSSHKDHKSSHCFLHASPHATGPISIPSSSPCAGSAFSLHASSPASKPAALQTVAHVSSSPTLHHVNHPATPVTQYHVESTNYPQSYPAMQRKVLQDLGSGQYFVVDVPVQVKTKTFFDPETGKYVQLNVRQTGQNISQPQLQQAYQQPKVQPQMQIKQQQSISSVVSGASKPLRFYQNYHSPSQNNQTSVVNSVHPSSSSIPATLHQNQQVLRENHSYGNPVPGVDQNSEGHRYSPEKTPYMDTVNDTTKTYNLVNSTTDACNPSLECDTNSQLSRSSVCENDLSANSECLPRDIIAISELEDFMEGAYWAQLAQVLPYPPRLRGGHLARGSSLWGTFPQSPLCCCVLELDGTWASWWGPEASPSSKQPAEALPQQFSLPNKAAGFIPLGQSDDRSQRQAHATLSSS
ncbi:hypothetical protein CRENBAI_014170 [Crenichthys baileyi]|uniref:DUF4585 domain-containing protein n=1 Tax=Crenichthys baileyi TaxID=28760 RepID=A0AAV9R014_9TELE